MKMKSSTLILLSAHDALLGIELSKGSLAKTAEGFEVDYLSSEAASFCLMGLLYAAEHDNNLHSEALEDSIAHLKRAIGGASIVGWNDKPERTKNEVLKALLKAAEMSEKS